MKAFVIKRRVPILVVAAVAVVGGIFWYIAANEAPSFRAIAVAKGDVIASVSDPATVLADNNVALSFEEAGKISAVYVKEGSNVTAGEEIASLDTSSLSANLNGADAALAAAQAELAQLQAGTRPEQLAIDEAAVSSASTSLAVAVSNAYTAADDAVTNQTDNLFSNPASGNPTLLLPTSESQAKIDVQNERVAIGETLANWFSALGASGNDPAATSKQADASLAQISAYLDQMAALVNGLAPTSLSQAMLSSYKADVAAARSEVGGTMTALSAAEAGLTNAQSALNLAEAGATPQAIEAQKAAVSEAQATVAGAQVAMNNAVLSAPFGGTVQNLTAMVGQVVSPNMQIGTLINNSGLKIETYISEADVANVKPGDVASVTLDAYGPDTYFPATVATVDPGKTEVNGAPAYMVTLHFAKPDGRLKDGMSGTVTIVTAERDNVIAVPSNLVIGSGNGYFVLVDNGGATKQVPVTVGLFGTNGLTEITSGLNVGDELLNL